MSMNNADKSATEILRDLKIEDPEDLNLGHLMEIPGVSEIKVKDLGSLLGGEGVPGESNSEMNMRILADLLSKTGGRGFGPAGRPVT